MFGSKKSNAATVETSAPSWGDYKDTTAKLLVVESVAAIETATEVPIQKIETGMTSKKAAAKAAREAKAAEKAATVPAVIVAPDLPETASAILAISTPAKVSDTIATRKALFDATVKETTIEERKARVIELMTRPEGASLQELQVYFWLAAVATRRLIEKAGYTTSQSTERPFRYFAKKV